MCPTRRRACLGAGAAIIDPRIGAGDICVRQRLVSRYCGGVFDRRSVGGAGRTPSPAAPATARLVAGRDIALSLGLACGARRHARRSICGWGYWEVSADPIARRIVGGWRHLGRFLRQHFLALASLA
jgi:hypothetical protein